MRTERMMLLCAMVLPLLGAIVYFVIFAQTPWIKPVYLAVKISMVALGFWGLQRSGVRTRDLFRIKHQDVVWGLIWGGICVAIIALSALTLWDTLDAVKAVVVERASALVSLSWYAVAALVFSIAHAFFEEWYWRGYITGELKKIFQSWGAVSISALAFTAHHVVVLSQLPPPTVVVLGSVGVFGAGVIWAWRGQKTSSLIGPWISHIFADIAVFIVGYLLISS